MSRPVPVVTCIHYLGLALLVLAFTGGLLLYGRVVLIGLIPVLGMALLAGITNRMDPQIGIPFFRWSLWNGTYEEYPRPIKCPRCHGTGRAWCAETMKFQGKVYKCLRGAEHPADEGHLFELHKGQDGLLIEKGAGRVE